MEDVKREAVRVAPGEGGALWVLGDLYEFKATGEETGGAYALFETTVAPGTPGPPPHVHRREEEAFYVLEVELNVEGSVSVAGPGSFVHIPRGTLHTFQERGRCPG